MKRYQLSTLYVLLIAAAFNIFNTEAVDTCDSLSGPAGYTHCIASSHYDDYQWATCRTNIYIQTKSNGKHICRDRTRTYCYYQCMIDVHGKGSGYVSSDCRCSLGELPPTQSVPLAVWCYSPDGKTCNWYKQCLNKVYPQCELYGDDHGLKFAEKFCNLYNEAYSNFSSTGQSWIDAVRKCLQLKLVPLVDKTTEKLCSNLQSTAFASHSPCYKPPNKSSYCDLSLDDRLKVFWSIKSVFRDAFVPSLKGLLDAMNECDSFTIRTYSARMKTRISRAVAGITRGMTDKAKQRADFIFKETKLRIKTWLEKDVSPFSPLPIQLDLSIRSEDFSNYFSLEKRSQFAGKVLDDVAAEENWKEKGVAWFGHANSDYNTQEHTMSIRLVVAERLKYDTSASATKLASLSNTLVELSAAVLNGTLNLIVDGGSIQILKMDGCLDWNCKEQAFSVEGNGAVAYGAIYTLALAYFVINIFFIPIC